MFWAENDALLFWVTLFLTKTEQAFAFAHAGSFSFNGKLLEQISTWL